MITSTLSTMTDPLVISLKACPAPNDTKESLPFLIARINEQRGSFRNVTEESLEEEIGALNAGEANLEDQTMVAHDAVDDIKSRKEEISTARDEIVRQVG